ncbi:alpha/beta hydrolase family protein [Mucilaginibacter sp. PAMB04168]|uniref:alpha/beta hydrolase n=1 Tax=Mucilaginibacter sp. PAMB04168 TaxID=3138567 RepID=UPI0031F5F26F
MKKLLLYLFLFIQLSNRANAQELMVIKSAYLHVNDTVRLYKPKQYAHGQTYPTVILLHGHGGNYKAWGYLANLQNLADEYGFIIACPDGLRSSWFMNAPDKNGMQWESFFINEFFPELKRKASVDTGKVFITGNSMGGHGAMWLFLRHPNLFLSAGSTSGVLNLRYSSYKNKSLSEILGTYAENNKQFDEYSSINQLTAEKVGGKYLIFDCGTEDYLYPANKKFRERCDSLKIKALFSAQPGRHQPNYWKYTILNHFRFFSALVKKKLPDQDYVKPVKP